MKDNTELSESYPHLNKINSPDDLKAVPSEEIPALAEEIREFLVKTVLENGGHLASNLGVVEMSLAIHRVFSSPRDHIIFDVGHQAYIHKLVTGRREAFSTLRQAGGLSGFPKRSESEHDCFGAGHSSTSLSAALGFAEADRLSGSDAYTVCVLGDGAYTGGMIHEALNNCRKKLRLIIIINENEMSISKNIGRFAKSLSRLRSTKGYFRTKNATTSFLRKIPLIGNGIFSFLRNVKVTIKSALYGSNYFENLGLYYLGPVNGNDEEAVERLLREAKESKQSCVIHLKTQKGRGYPPAEATPDRYHGVAPAAWFTVDTFEHLKHGGRVSAVSAAVGGVLHIKPLLHVLEDGTLAVAKKPRGTKQAMRAQLEQMADGWTPDLVVIGHADNPLGAITLRDQVQERFPDAEIHTADIGAVIGAHVGSGMLALIYWGTTR